MEIFSDFLDEEVPKILRSVHDAGCLGFVSDSIAEALLVFLNAQTHLTVTLHSRDSYWCAQICNVSSGEEIVDEDQEAFIDDLVVCHEEGDGHALGPCLVIQCQQVLFEVRNAVG